MACVCVCLGWAVGDRDQGPAEVHLLVTVVIPSVCVAELPACTLQTGRHVWKGRNFRKAQILDSLTHWVDYLSSCSNLLKGRERQCHGELTPGWLRRSPMLWSLQEKGSRRPAGHSHSAGRTRRSGGPESSPAGPQAPRAPAPLLLAPGSPHLPDPSLAPFSPGASRRPWSQHLLRAPFLLSLLLLSGPSSIAKVACLLAAPKLRLQPELPWSSTHA